MSYPASAATLAESVCPSLGGIAETTVKARNKGISKDTLMSALLEHEYSPLTIRLATTTIDFAYNLPKGISPYTAKLAATELCFETLNGYN